MCNVSVYNGEVVERCFAMACPIDKVIVQAGMVSVLEAKVAELEQDLADRKNEREFVGAHLESWAKRFERIKVELQEYADQGDIDPDESTLHQFLTDEFELDFFEEKSIILTITQGVTVKVRKGYDLSGYDFDINVTVDGSTDDIEVLDYEGAEVTDWEDN